jgi:hypothetical protein
MQSCYAVHTIKTDVKREKNITEKTEFPVTNKHGMRKNLLTIQLSLYGFAGMKNSLKKIIKDTFHAECTRNFSLGTVPINSCIF